MHCKNCGHLKGVHEMEKDECFTYLEDDPYSVTSVCPCRRFES